jgi:UDP-2,3-diacylglucosamine pyrophosphatase LpxH
MEYWSFSQYIKLKVKSACSHISRFEDAVIQEARSTGHRAVVCGHIHKAEVREGPVMYYNCGDWVESCTALVEHENGRFELIDGLSIPAAAGQTSEGREPPEDVPVRFEAALLAGTAN